MGNSNPKPPPAAAGAAEGHPDEEDHDEGQGEKAPGLWASAKQGYEELICAIIRPPRAEYTLEDLGPPKFKYGGREFQRTDLVLTNSRGLKLQCSHWEPVDADRPAPELPCVIYLHGNSSCRTLCVDNLDVAFGIGATMFGFDFAGSGQSEGEFVTLGEFEKDDVAAVIAHLRGTGRVSTIGLWGRSMGAATALLHSHRDPTMACIILDSPFADLRQLANELVLTAKEQVGFKIPGLLVKAAIKVIRSAVLKRSGMDIDKLKPIEHVDKAFIPALFCHGQNDNFIAPHHSQQIFDKYAGDKDLALVPGDHNSMRPPSFQHRAAVFLQNAMRIPHDFELVGDPEDRMSVPESWHRVARTARMTTTHRPMMDDEEDAMIQQALAASLLLAGSGKSSVTRGPSIARVANPAASGSGAASASHPSAVAAPKSASAAPEADEGLQDWTSEPSAGLGAAQVQLLPPGLEDGDEEDVLPSAFVMGIASSLRAPSTEWACQACTFINAAGRSHCDVCGSQAGPEPVAALDSDAVLPPPRTPAVSVAEPTPGISSVTHTSQGQPQAP